MSQVVRVLYDGGVAHPEHAGRGEDHHHGARVHQQVSGRQQGQGGSTRHEKRAGVVWIMLWRCGWWCRFSLTRRRMEEEFSGAVHDACMVTTEISQVRQPLTSAA